MLDLGELRVLLSLIIISSEVLLIEEYDPEEWSGYTRDGVWSLSKPMSIVKFLLLALRHMCLRLKRSWRIFTNSVCLFSRIRDVRVDFSEDLTIIVVFEGVVVPIETPLAVVSSPVETILWCFSELVAILVAFWNFLLDLFFWSA